MIRVDLTTAMLCTILSFHIPPHVVDIEIRRALRSISELHVRTITRIQINGNVSAEESRGTRQDLFETSLF